MSFSHCSSCGQPWIGHGTACVPLTTAGVYIAGQIAQPTAQTRAHVHDQLGEALGALGVLLRVPALAAIISSDVARMRTAGRALGVIPWDGYDGDARIAAAVATLQPNSAVDTPEDAFARGFKAGMRAAGEAIERAKLDVEPPPYHLPVHLDQLVGLCRDEAAPAEHAVTRRVVCAAVRRDNRVFLGVRHGDAGHRMRNVMPDGPDGDQGFVDQRGTYMDRREAWAVAEAAGQIIRRGPGFDGPELFSENIY